MRVIASGRKTSRTTQLIELCHEAEMRGEPSYIVCRDSEAARRVFDRAGEMHKRIKFPITFDDLRLYAHPSIANLFIDDADKLLQTLTPVRIATVTILKEPDE